MATKPRHATNIKFSDFAGAKNQSADQKKAVRSLSSAYEAERTLCAHDFWYFAQFLRTYDEENACERQAPLNYDYLRKLHYDTENNQKNVTLKSRRLFISWFYTARQLWRGKFAGTGLPGSLDVFKGSVFSIGETEAEELMRRVTHLHERLPDWLRLWNPMNGDRQMRKDFERGGSSHAFPLKKEGPRTFGFTEAFFDEMAFQEGVRRVWQGLLPSLGANGKINAVSTPNGKFNLFSDIWHNKGERFNGINRIKLNWWDHPEHDQAWFDAVTAGMTAQQVAQEFELSFSVPQGEAVFPEYQRKVHVGPADTLKFFPKKPVYIGFDLGYHFPAMTLWQRNSRDQWVGFKEHLMYDIDFDTFCKQGLELLEATYDRKDHPEMFCLPTDAKLPYRTKAASGAMNDLGVIRDVFHVKPHQTRFGPQEVGTRSNEGPRIKEVRAVLKLRKDGEPGLYNSDSMEMFTDAMLGGYCYPEVRGVNDRVSEQPAENEYTHVVDSAQAVVTVYNRMIDPDNMLQERQQGPMRPGIIHDRIHRKDRTGPINYKRRR